MTEPNAVQRLFDWATEARAILADRYPRFASLADPILAAVEVRQWVEAVTDEDRGFLVDAIDRWLALDSRPNVTVEVPTHWLRSFRSALRSPVQPPAVSSEEREDLARRVEGDKGDRLTAEERLRIARLLRTPVQPASGVPVYDHERRRACPMCDMGIPLSESSPEHNWYDPGRDRTFTVPCFYDTSAPSAQAGGGQDVKYGAGCQRCGCRELMQHGCVCACHMIHRSAHPPATGGEAEPAIGYWQAWRPFITTDNPVVTHHVTAAGDALAAALAEANKRAEAAEKLAGDLNEIIDELARNIARATRQDSRDGG